MEKTLPLRKDVPIEETWNLKDIYETEEAFQLALSETIEKGKDFKNLYETKIIDIQEVEELVIVIEAYQDILTNFYRLMGYSSLDTQTDMTNAQAQTRLGKASVQASQMMASLSFFDSELNALSDDFLMKVAKESSYGLMIGDVIKQKKHQLQPESEMILKALSPVLNLPDDGYNITKLSDMKFNDFEVNGKSYPLSFVQFENNYQTHSDTAIRRAAFKQFSSDLKTYQNTVANYYNTQVQKEKIMATLRGYESVFDYLLDSQDVSLDLYNRQIDVLMEELAPHMRRYAQKLKARLGVDQLYYSDLKAPFMADEKKEISYEDAKTLVIEALGVLGERYTKEVIRCFDERWIDYAGNLGKSTGGFCSSVPGVHPYILLSWNASLSEVFTLAHEIGHAIQSVFSKEKYPNAFTRKMSLYTIEAPSTFNEMLLSKHLLKKNPELAQWVASSMIENTYYHNFVTHFLEAAFQREVYKRIDENDALQASDFNALFKQQLEKFWGDSVILDEGAELTWMRQPHYYMGLYSYTYSAGLTISTTLSERLNVGNNDIVEKWLIALSETETQKPLDFAKLVDIDLSTDAPLKETIVAIGKLVDQL